MPSPSRDAEKTWKFFQLFNSKNSKHGFLTAIGAGLGLRHKRLALSFTPKIFGKY